MADLPEHWSYGVCGDGRVFFINDEELRTTWLHPRSGESVNSGHMMRSDLPQGWEEGFTDDGASYLINHNQRITTFRHPVTGRVATDNLDFILQQQPQGVLTMSLPPAGKPGRPSSTTVSESSTTFTSSTVDTNSAAKGSRSSGKIHGFGKRQQSLKRNPNVPVAVRGWLYKQDSTGMRLWKRKWFVLADYCLFYYKDSREESVLGSIPLPSYVISHIGPEDHISRKFAFKAGHTGMRAYAQKPRSVIGSQAEHGGMRTYYFSADTQEDQSGWLRAMNQAAQMKNQAVVRSKEILLSLDPQQAVPLTNHGRPHPSETSDHQETHLEPLRPGPSDHAGTLLRDPAPVPMEMDTHSSLVSNPAASSSSHFSPLTDAGPPSAPGSRAPSRATSALPEPCTYNGLSACTTPSPILEPNGIGAGTYQRNPEPPGPEPPHREPPHREPYRGDGRSSTLEQVEQWVQVQRAEVKGPPSRENTLPRRSPATLPHSSSSREVRYQTLPRTPGPSPPPATRTGEYKYAQDRLSHFQLAPEPAGPGGGGGPVYQLYEWQQRHQYRHGSPTAPLYTPAPDYPYGPRPPSAGPSASSAPRPSDGHPRCISVPPSPADLPPPGVGRTASPLRRPHTPAERVTVRPVRSEVDGPFAASPRRAKSQMFKAATMERRAGPASGYISHTVSAPSLHGKTTDDAYMQLKKDLEYLDLKVVGSQFLKEVGKPVKVAESDVDVKLSRLCEQDKTLKDLESRISTLKDDKDQLERVLDISRQQMEQYQEQPGHAHKIAYQQRLLQEDLVTIRASISRLSTEMSGAWQEYVSLESSVEQLRKAMQAHMNHSSTPQQEKTELKRELWRIEDVMAGLSSSKTNYRITIQSVQNPERKLVPSLSEGVLTQPPSCYSPPGLLSLPHGAAEHWCGPPQVEDGAPPRPPLPSLYDYEDTPPAVPPLPREAAAVVRHTSVRGLKRQSDERKRDRESGQYPLNGDCKVELRSYLSEPDLPVMDHSSAGSDPDTPSFSDKGLFSSGLNQSTSISSYVTLRRGPGGSQAARERPQSALDQMYAVSHGAPAPPCQTRGRMSAEEQLERMKRHQRALVRDRQRNLSQGERPCSSGSPPQRCSSRTPWNQGQEPSPSTPPWEPMHQSGGPPCEPGPRRRLDTAPLQGFDPREERPGAEGQSDEGPGTERGSGQSEGWMYPSCVAREMDLEPVDYDLDLSRELSRPPKVPIPERYVESDPDEPQSREELEKRSQRAQRIRTLLAKSSVHSLQPALGPSLDFTPLDFSELDSVLQQQERIMSVSQALASEASRKSKLVAEGRTDRLLVGTPSWDSWCFGFMSGLFGFLQGMGTDPEHERCELVVCNVITMCTYRKLNVPWAPPPSVGGAHQIFCWRQES
ncbi:pleckstrin homology domain-containing family A member 7-like isoform X1 [Gadus chalcogrammus]|uniref:pleckstrin homology domain-containing family A member 7-like isoform X1 n=2 Tax=Gadus chalcogrammus TaxID=1042646 RepID=UPI0024C49AA7|nr:pleckstrin homology domain-containing family A member 7-like isoform X1 [Gadus chalcogrammus]